MENSKRVLTLEERQKIMTYPVYFQSAITQAALEGEDIETIANQLKDDWAPYT